MKFNGRWTARRFLPAVVLVALIACGGSSPALLSPTLPTPAQTLTEPEGLPWLGGSVEGGTTIFSGACAVCHGQAGSGDRVCPPPS